MAIPRNLLWQNQGFLLDRIQKPSLGTLLRLSAALDVTVDTLLRGNQPAEANAFYSDVQHLLDDCSQKERRVLLEIAAAVKQILRDAA